MSIQSPKSALPTHINLIWLRCCASVKLPIHEDRVVFVLAWPQVQDKQRLIQKKKKKKNRSSTAVKPGCAELLSPKFTSDFEPTSLYSSALRIAWPGCV